MEFIDKFWQLVHRQPNCYLCIHVQVFTWFSVNSLYWKFNVIINVEMNTGTSSMSFGIKFSMHLVVISAAKFLSRIQDLNHWWFQCSHLYFKWMNSWMSNSLKSIVHFFFFNKTEKWMRAGFTHTVIQTILRRINFCQCLCLLDEGCGRNADRSWL